MTDSQQQAREILDRLVFTDFDLCLEIERTFTHLPHAPGIYAIRHRTDGLLYLGKTNDLSTRFNGGHKAFTWAWLDLYAPSTRRRKLGYYFTLPTPRSPLPAKIVTRFTP